LRGAPDGGVNRARCVTQCRDTVGAAVADRCDRFRCDARPLAWRSRPSARAVPKRVSRETFVPGGAAQLHGGSARPSRDGLGKAHPISGATRASLMASRATAVDAEVSEHAPVIEEAVTTSRDLKAWTQSRRIPPHFRRPQADAARLLCGASAGDMGRPRPPSPTNARSRSGALDHRRHRRPQHVHCPVRRRPTVKHRAQHRRPVGVPHRALSADAAID
jgi:hypothetical protein